MCQTKVVCKDQHTHFEFSNVFFLNCTFYEIRCKNIVVPDRPHAIWRIRIAFWIPKSTNTPSEYVINFAFPRQQWLHEGDSILRYSITTLSDLCYRLGIDRFAHHKPESHKTQPHPTMIITKISKVFMNVCQLDILEAV